MRLYHVVFLRGPIIYLSLVLCFCGLISKHCISRWDSMIASQKWMFIKEADFLKMPL
ncbi:hypothetical protein PAXRUDRAFT_826826 [Paxillus rubicundulus Ve08.2h10]|uniref:Uncharacterized protein n=1 Tax=Paxillus rubicundulus Ve08.2h10 TaxID=930991 RepID=A0A0D0DRG7_9AGAM|nr:hypothetical protein PAXRUDRAFT_826826 [Paxillus rubicundulus Ve08.2h10]